MVASNGHGRALPAAAIAAADARPAGTRRRELGDFTTTRSVLALAALAVPIGIAVALLALALLDLIGLITHLAYTGTLSTSLAPPDVSVLGVWSVLVPVAGGLIVGMMARVGSERIRGHGIPEAMETILLRGSRMEPRLAVLKPLSSAISIGSGGPFGAEGPIIVTGGALGSIAGQLLHLTAAERRTLLVAGAAGGMTAVFGTPVAAVLLAVELLLFEWRPRSMVPVAVAACTAAVVREALSRAGLLRAAPLFPTAAHGPLGASVTAGAILVGLSCGGLAWAMTRCVYGAEDLFERLPLHWAWWPALGGFVVGVGGLIEPRALGVGYQTIGAELAGRLALETLLVLLIVKLSIWSIALGSNTSGGILAPVLMIGAALGGLLGAVLSGASEGTWALLGLAAALAGVTRSPLTSIVFALELTHDVNALLALLVACTAAHLVSVLLLKRSILTEKVARRGYHVTREYEIDPLHALLVRDVMSTERSRSRRRSPSPISTGGCRRAATRAASGFTRCSRRRGRCSVCLPSRTCWRTTISERRGAGELARAPLLAFSDETLREVADRMLASGHHVLPVADRRDGRVLGLVSQADLLRAHERVLIEERRRERPLRPRGPSRDPRTQLPAARSRGERFHVRPAGCATRTTSDCSRSAASCAASCAGASRRRTIRG